MARHIPLDDSCGAERWAARACWHGAVWGEAAARPEPSPCFWGRAQEVAGNNGVALWGRTEEGFATDPIMVANNLIFVATRIQIQMDSYPKWCALNP